MANLVLVGDCSEPLSFDNGDPYPRDMVAVAGYLGGVTPYVWTAEDITRIRSSGRQFWPIWTAPNSKQGIAINSAVGTSDGRMMAAVLRDRAFPQSVPVFYDVEYNTYAADPTGAQAAISAFKREVYAAGWSDVFAYAPKMFNRDWVAWWTNIKPTTLPVDWIGQQYSGRPGLDFSVFDLDKLGIDMRVSDEDVQRIAEATRAAVSGTIQQYIPAELGGTIQRIVQILGLEQQEAGDVAAVKTALTTFGTPDSPMTPEQEHAFAVELAKVFGTALDAAT